MYTASKAFYNQLYCKIKTATDTIGVILLKKKNHYI